MKVGILGGGQLSRMLAFAGIPLGVNFCFYEPRQENCVSNLGDVINESYTNLDSIVEFAKSCDVVTYENENIPIEVLELIAQRKPLHPNIQALKIAQDRLLEKKFFDELAIETPPYENLISLNSLKAFIEAYGFPVIIKKRRHGYDGKGQIYLSGQDDLSQIDQKMIEDTIVEKVVSFDREVSIIAIRDVHGGCRYYDLCENYHQQGILRHTQNKRDDSKFSLAKEYIDKILQSLDYVGCLAFEFFEKGAQMLANEIAPRVHNSGHWTLEGAAISQFENHIRAITGLPLGNTQSRGPYQMINLLGKMPDKQEILGYDFIHLHDYQKAIRKGRKNGHICIPLTSSSLPHIEQILKMLA